MHQATCAECGDRCEVPFKPNGEKPVYCSNCFGNNSDSDRFDKKEFKPKKFATEPTHSAGSQDLKEEVKQLNLKLDKVLALLQRTNSVKEVTVMKTGEEKKSEKAPAKTVEKPMTKKTVAVKAVVKEAPKAKVAPVKKVAVAKKVEVKKPAAKKAAPKKAKK